MKAGLCARFARKVAATVRVAASDEVTWKVDRQKEFARDCNWLLRRSFLARIARVSPHQSDPRFKGILRRTRRQGLSCLRRLLLLPLLLRGFCAAVALTLEDSHHLELLLLLRLVPLNELLPVIDDAIHEGKGRQAVATVNRSKDASPLRLLRQPRVRGVRSHRMRREASKHTIA